MKSFYWSSPLFELNCRLFFIRFIKKISHQMNPRFYDPFDENALSFVELNKKRRRHSNFVEAAGGTADEHKMDEKAGGGQKDISKVNAHGILERSGSFDKKAQKNGWPNIEPIWNRRDQTSPEAYVIYVFLNGDGLNCRNVSFTRLQLKVGGIRHVMELVAREFNARPKKLVRMDGSKLGSTNDLATRGAYILVPAGENLTECWYYLPDYAVDTSLSSERVLVRRRGSMKAMEEARKAAQLYHQKSPKIVVMSAAGPSTPHKINNNDAKMPMP